MSLNSSTSSSDAAGARRYLALLAAVTAALLLAAAAISVFGIRHRVMTWHYTQLLRYQFDKLSKAEGAKVLLVGDSSLGNAIDARAWSGALGKPVLSLALTGAYGYGGSLNMIRNALRSQPIETVILFQFAGMMREPVTFEGMVLTADRWSDLDLVPFSAVWSSVVNFSMAVNVTGTFVLRGGSRLDSFVPNDYVPQDAAMPLLGPEPAPVKLDPAAIRPGHARVLSAIAALCNEKKLRCLYVHGPLTRSICDNSADFIATENRVVRATGLTPVEGTPICLPWRDTGDTENHVTPRLKPDYSARYLALVRPYLAGN